MGIEIYGYESDARGRIFGCKARIQGYLDIAHASLHAIASPRYSSEAFQTRVKSDPRVPIQSPTIVLRRGDERGMILMWTFYRETLLISSLSM